MNGYLALTPAEALIILGVIFIGLEAFIPTLGASAVIGLIAFTLGIIGVCHTKNLPVLDFSWDFVLAVMSFGVIMVGIVLLLAARAYEADTITGPEGMIGHTAKIVEWNGTAGHVRIQSETWQAVSDNPLTLNNGDSVRVQAVENLTLRIGIDG